MAKSKENQFQAPDGWKHDYDALDRIFRETGYKPLLVEVIRVSDVNEGCRATVQPRSEFSIDDEVVERIVLALKRGEDLHILVGCWIDKRFVILGGNHRYKGLKVAGKKEFCAYVIPIERIKNQRRLARKLNNQHGSATSLEDKKLDGIEYMKEHPGCTIKEAAFDAEISEDTLKRAYEVWKTTNRLRNGGFVARLDDCIKIAIGKLHNQDVLLKMAEVARCDLGTDVIQAEVRVLLDKETDEERLDEIERFKREHRLSEQIIKKVVAGNADIVTYATSPNKTSNGVLERTIKVLRTAKNHFVGKTPNAIGVKNDRDKELVLIAWQALQGVMREVFADVDVIPVSNGQTMRD